MPTPPGAGQHHRALEAAEPAADREHRVGALLAGDPGHVQVEKDPVTGRRRLYYDRKIAEGKTQAGRAGSVVWCAGSML